MRIEEVDMYEWEKYSNDVIEEIEKLKKVRASWESNPNPTAEFLADIRIKLSISSANLVDSMRPLALIEPMWVAKVHRDKKESWDLAREQSSTATEAASLFKHYDPYNTSLEIQGVLKRLLDYSYNQAEQARNISNALSTKTRDVYQNSDMIGHDYSEENIPEDIEIKTTKYF